MRTYLIAFGLSLLAGLLFTRWIRDFANRHELVDAPTKGRKIHKTAVPRLGGVAVIVATALPLLGLLMWDNKLSRALAADQSLWVSLIGGGSIIILVGLWDDIKGCKAVFKLTAQVAAAMVVYWSGLRIEAVSVPFFAPLHLGDFSLVITVFWMVLVINSINLIDGLDGLAGGVVTLAGGTLFIMSVVEGNDLAALLLVAMVGATMGFLAYNLTAASIFLGDTGSLMLGFILALVSVHSSQKSYTLFSIVAALFALGLPIFDLSMAVVRRFLSGKPIFGADQHHIHHLLLRKGLSKGQSVALLFGAAIMLEALALVFIYANDQVSALVLVLLVPIIVAAVHFLGYGGLIKSARRAKVLIHAEEDAQLQTELVRGAREDLMQAGDLEQVWDIVEETVSRLQFEWVEIVDVDGEQLCSWRRTEMRADEVHLQTLMDDSMPLVACGHTFGDFRYGYFQESQPFLPLGWANCQLLADAVAQKLFMLQQGQQVSQLA